MFFAVTLDMEWPVRWSPTPPARAAPRRNEVSCGCCTCSGHRGTCATLCVLLRQLYLDSDTPVFGNSNNRYTLFPDARIKMRNTTVLVLSRFHVTARYVPHKCPEGWVTQCRWWPWKLDGFCRENHAWWASNVLVTKSVTKGRVIMLL